MESHTNLNESLLLKLNSLKIYDSWFWGPQIAWRWKDQIAYQIAWFSSDLHAGKVMWFQATTEDIIMSLPTKFNKSLGTQIMTFGQDFKL